ncbi:hypothetical protein GGS26DRAFT_598711 [Hypomontagnella submonticulosa]|nr:hypothetical protein GGS26DRAFT_598711 [Hypomontagnella submonticulosa]
MRTKAALSALTLFSLGVAAELTAPDGYGGVVASGASECLIKEGSRRDIKIKDFSYGEMISHPGDIPPRPSTATVSFSIAYTASWWQACSGFIVQTQDGEWQDKDGSAWFKCGTENTPDPTCWNCTHFQFGWGHDSWRFAINQTWPCASSGHGSCEISYELSGSATLNPKCTEDTNSFTSCTAPEFSLSLNVYGHMAREPGCTK